MRLLPSHHVGVPGSTGKSNTLVVVLAALVLTGSLFALWELVLGTGPAKRAPLSRSEPAQVRGSTDPATMDAPESDSAQPVRSSPPSGTRPGTRPGPGPGPASAIQESALDGPDLRRQLATVARTFRTATPDLRGLNNLIRSLAQHSEVLPESLERTAGRICGRVQLEQTDLEAEFEVLGSAYEVRFREYSYDTVHPPFLRLELTIAFDTGARHLSATSATLAFLPNPERKSMDHIRIGDELRVGWKVLFGPRGATARGIGARVGSDLKAWDVSPSEKTRSDKRVGDLSSFQAWRGLLPRLVH